jgi:hypothetical protein
MVGCYTLDSITPAIHLSAWRDCPKKGLSNAPKVDWDAMRKSKWVEKSLLGDL